ncbi:uncharacterized protein LOC105430019 isoform X1 [Pogonomyrmex barbatus]|uniref:Uncharacterized protein LOC105430019 isoform X1 n=2 Tax=Pogonomyrmex barbatus TaxID=144034 RepID=A0A6I9WPV6_9HYME|nr:uncharacterized protein LOC105430019 isoform X1 [Pogonomyrmex barbatus]XP_011641629.1 uncharacterized protein LOC105430019 isoform X1 [Pogonomyrmex barbatus]
MFCISDKFRKLECTVGDESPTKSEIRQSLGTSLAQIIFEYNQEAAKLVDSISVTKFPQQLCCASQDSQLKADMAMGMWSEKQKILKSCIHREILALGEDELKKFQAEIEAATQKKLRNEFAEECRMFEAEKRFAIRRNADEIHAQYEEFFKFAQQELKEKLQVDMADIDMKHDKELQTAIVKTRMDTTYDVLRKIQPQINWVVTSIYNDLVQAHRIQKDKMVVDFNNIMRKRHIKFDEKIKNIEKRKIEELYTQRRELEIQNVINIIYIFYMERLHSNSQLQAIQEHYEEKIKSFQKLIAKQNEAVNIMKEEITECHNKNKMLEEKITILAKEFQKFINFAFDTMPEHADFLLPLDLLSVNSTNKEDGEREEKKR